MTEERRIDVDDATYRLRPWSYKDGRDWLFELFSIATAAGAGAAESDGAAIGRLLSAVDRKTWDGLCAMVEKYTDVVKTEDGSERIIPLSQVAAVHMRGRHIDLAVLVRSHLETEFGPFFVRLPEVLGGLGDRRAG